MKFVSTLSLLVGLGVGVPYLPSAQAQTPKKEVSKADKTKAKKATTAAEKAVKAGDFEKALASYQEAYGLDPTPDSQAAIGDCYASLTRYKEALAAYNQYLTEAGFAHPRRAEIEKKIPETKLSIANAAKTQGDIAFSGKDFNKALSLYKEAQEMSQDPIYFYKMGSAYAKLNNYKEGVDAFNSFLQKAPATDTNRADAEQQTAMLQQGAADAAFAAGQYDEAISYYRMLYAKDAQPKRLAELGRCYQKMGKTDDANTNFRAFLEKSDPNDPLRPEIEAQLPKKAAGNTSKNDKGNKNNKSDKGDKTKDPTTEKSAAPKVFLGLAFTSGALAAASGVGAFLSTQQLNELTAPASAAELDTDQIALHQARRTLLAPAADIFLGVAAVTGVVGIIARSKNKPEKAAQLHASPNSVTVVVKF